MYGTDAVALRGRLRWERRRRHRQAWLKRMRWTGLALICLVGLAFALAQTVQGSGPPEYQTVRVRAGDTLWTIAARRYPAADARVQVDQIMRINHLAGPVLFPGETLEVPLRG